MEIVEEREDEVSVTVKDRQVVEPAKENYPKENPKGEEKLVVVYAVQQFLDDFEDAKIIYQIVDGGKLRIDRVEGDQNEVRTSSEVEFELFAGDCDKRIFRTCRIRRRIE